MSVTSQFAGRYKKDLSTEALREKNARRKSVAQKENRHKLFEKGRQFGLADVNVQQPTERGKSQPNETGKTGSQEKSIGNQKQSTNGATKKVNGRKELLQRYKEEKELRKQKEQKEKAKKGVFKVGLYRPTEPGYLSLLPEEAVKTRGKAPPAYSGRITRSKNQEEKSLIPIASKPSTVSNGPSIRPTQAARKQIGADKVGEKKKVLQPAAQTTSNVRITRGAAAAAAAAASAARQVPKTTAAAATTGNQSQRKTANGGKQKTVKPAITKAIPSKSEADNNAQLDPLMEDSAADPKHLELEQDQTSVQDTTHCASGRPRTRSFAPQNFVFQPLHGLATYKVTPMSPSRANAFLTPAAFWDSSKSPVKIIQKNSETKAQEADVKSQVSPAGEDFLVEEMTTSLEEKADESDEKTSVQTASETADAPAIATALDTKPDDVKEEEEHNVPYFRNILQSETEKLTFQCLQWDVKLELDIPEDAKDLIRTTVGQTRLLIAERFMQFEGLVDNCEFKRGKKETTCADLDGFWDMINFQVEDVKKKFDNLKKLEDNEWQPPEIPSKAAVKKKAVSSGVPKPELGAAGRIAARSRLAAVKAAMRDKMKQDGATHCLQQKELPEVEKVVFDGGFFRIESPAKTFPGSTPGRASQRTSDKLATPRSSSRALLQRVLPALPHTRDETANHTPVLKGFHPAQSLRIHQLPTEKAPPLEELPAFCLEQRNTLMSHILPDCKKQFKFLFFQVLENSSSELKAMDGMEEMELSAVEQEERDVIMGSPEKEMGSENDSTESEEPKPHQ
ncbi:DLGP5 protein, partial [Turnix velox]|nr:DLGP5 protein [Turnix velox]